tara:strand:+ start:1265 stop:1804 length:540 start_codon:yes stop_codon:yes gene_type:complete
MLAKILAGCVFIIFIALGALFFMVIPESNKKLTDSSESQNEIKMAQNKIGEITERQDNKWIYQGFKLDSLKAELNNHITVYKKKIDSLDLVIEQVKFSMERMDDRLTQKDEMLQEEILKVSDLFDAFKRKTNRDLRTIKKDIKDNKSDIADLQLFDERVKEKSLYTEEELEELKAKEKE